MARNEIKNKILYGSLSAVLAAYIITFPACGNKSSDNLVGNSYACIPGQYCTSGPGGIPLINGQSVSQLDPNGMNPYGPSYLVLNYAAPGVTAGQGYSGPINVWGTLHLSPGDCPTGVAGDFQVSGQGQWISGYGGFIAQAQAAMQATGGGVGGGQVTFGPSLIDNNPTGFMGLPFALTYSAGVSVSFCKTFGAIYN